MKVLLLAFALLAATEARRFCKVDDDCTDLGEITCQYSRCDTWGICGCPRGYATRFMGSEKKFQCAMLKKLGESCSEDGSNGVCGPDSSYCDGGKCRCMANFVEAWDGEKCLPPYELSLHYGETCSESLGECGSSSGSCTEGDNFRRAALDYEMPVCTCGNTERLYIPNAFEISPFVGRREPRCILIAVGDQCMYDGQCPSNSVCVNDECVCDDNYKDSENGCMADTTTVLSQGQVCQTTTTLDLCGPNMECGDVCEPDKYNDLTNNDRICTCIFGYTGSSCTAVTEGATCSGDSQCKGIGYDALCIDGACVAGAAGITFSLVTMLCMVVAHYL